MQKKVLITGASKGIGLALSRHFLAHNYEVIGTSRTGKIIEITHSSFTPIALDLSKTDSVANALKELESLKVTFDIFINNAGIGPDLNYTEPEQDTYLKTFEVNTTGTTFFIEKMISNITKEGKIIIISSKMGSIEMCSSSCSVAYRMSKAALNMYSKILANKLNGFPKVAVIHPGWVRTMISGDNTSGRLSPEESALGIFDFVISDFDNSAFWDIETQTHLPW